ncbi:MAG: hypothetical protein ACJ77N_15695 [Chloroflexota bacterium]
MTTAARSPDAAFGARLAAAAATRTPDGAAALDGLGTATVAWNGAWPGANLEPTRPLAVAALGAVVADEAESGPVAAWISPACTAVTVTDSTARRTARIVTRRERGRLEWAMPRAFAAAFARSTGRWSGAPWEGSAARGAVAKRQWW